MKVWIKQIKWWLSITIKTAMVLYWFRELRSFSVYFVIYLIWLSINNFLCIFDINNKSKKCHLQTRNPLRSWPSNWKSLNLLIWKPVPVALVTARPSFFCVRVTPFFSLWLYFISSFPLNALQTNKRPRWSEADLLQCVCLINVGCELRPSVSLCSGKWQWCRIFNNNSSLDTDL